MGTMIIKLPKVAWLVRKRVHAGRYHYLYVSLTPKGRASWHRVMKLIERCNADSFGCQTGDRKQLSEMLDRVNRRAIEPPTDACSNDDDRMS